MTRNGNGTFGMGNKMGPGKPKGRSNSQLLELHRFGEDRIMTHYAMLDRLAAEGDVECAKFMVERVLPKAKGSRHLKFDLGPIRTLDEIKEAQNNIVENISSGDITIEEGQKLSDIIKDRQKTIEMIEFSQRMEEINDRMKKAGI